MGLTPRFRTRFLKLLEAAFAGEKLVLRGKLEELAKARHRNKLLVSLRNRDWVVYAKPPFGGPQQVLKYLARYTHRVAIANQRLTGIDDGKVSFRWKDYKNHNRTSVMTLEAVEFIRRFLLHALPKSFQRIRHFGFLANRVRRDKLALCRSLLANEPAQSAPVPAPDQALLESPPQTTSLCPKCEKGQMIVTDSFDAAPDSIDSS